MDSFPVRFAAKPLVVLDPEFGLPMDDLLGRVQFYEGPEDRGKFKGFVRSSPSQFKEERDAEVILNLLNKAAAEPTYRPVDPRKLARRPYYTTGKGATDLAEEVIVSIPDAADINGLLTSGTPDDVSDQGSVGSTTRHSEMQYRLLALGYSLGLDVWVARNDRSRAWNGNTLGSALGILSKLPTQFNDATTKTIELIDVLWLKGHTIVGAFEVECTTSIYSGLLRMSDLLALQPNLDIDLYLVGPNERRTKVEQEILRPTFLVRERPLYRICGFLAFEQLVATVEGIERLNLASSLKPDFLKKVATYFAPPRA